MNYKKERKENGKLISEVISTKNYPTPVTEMKS